MPDNAPKWTPGPWIYAPTPGYQYVVEIDKPAQVLLVAAAVPPGREAEIRANMQLAAAAPDLYTALEVAFAMVKGWHGLFAIAVPAFHAQRGFHGMEAWEAFCNRNDGAKQIISALAKARGEQTDGQ